MLEWTTVSGGAMVAELPAAGGYFSIIKILLVLVLVTPWFAVAPWVHRDLAWVRGAKLAWSTAVLAAGVLGVLVWLLLPIYIVGLLIYVVLTASTLLAYVVYRNQRVEESDKILTAEHLSNILSFGSAARKRQPQVINRLQVYSPHGTVIQPPDPQTADPETIAGHNLTQDMLYDMFWRRASEVDFTPVGGGQTRVRMVIDGVPTERPAISTQDSDRMVRYLKKIADLDVEEVRRPQNGTISVEFPGREACEVAVTTTGTTEGQRVRVRITEKVIHTRLNELGMPDDVRSHIQQICAEGKGLIVVSGRPGSGVTSTLYSLLRNQDPYVKLLMTLESEVEVDIEGVTQDGYGDPARLPSRFAATMRRDPDVVMVDQCPDQRVAEQLTEAAREKLILVGLPASDTFTALARWVRTAGGTQALDALRAVLCQMLLRRLCENCREAYRPDPEMLAKANLPAESIERFYRPPTEPLTDEKGNPITCGVCQGTGYVGRTAVFELLEVTDELRQAVAQGASLSQIKSLARKRKMLYLQEQALRKVMAGETSVKEILRVTQKQKKAT